MLKRILLPLCLLPLLLYQSLAQGQTELTNFLRTFQEYHDTNPVEKIFLHLDKTEYAQAETIWIKSYLVAGPGHLPSPLSRNVYVELLSEKGDMVERLILRSEAGMSKASLLIPRQLPQGNYYLRAYTNWMKNAGQDFFFNKKIKVHSIEPDKNITPATIIAAANIRFYPEGGHLVKNVASKVAFEIYGIDTEEQVHTATLYNNRDEEVASFSTSHEGRGLFSFVPKEAEYYARINGSDKRFALPRINSTGLVMSANNKRDDYLTVTIKSNEIGCEPYYLITHTRGYITYASQVQMTSTRGFVKVPKTSLPAGITHITVLDKALTPVAERLAFINPDENLKVEISPDKTNYGTREIATVSVKVTDAQGLPVQGSFSLSAFDQGLVQNDQPDYNIATNLLLSSDLKGHIKDPSQYFANDRESQDRLDLLMMVNGWRRFDWSDIGELKEPTHAIETGLTLQGKLLKNNGGAAKDGRVLLINTNQEEANAPMALADENGYFRFDNLTYYDTTRLTLQGFQRASMKNVRFKIDSAFEIFPLTNLYETSSVFENPLRVTAYKKYAKTAIYIDSTYRRVNGITYLGDVTVVADKRKEKYRVLQSKYGEGESYLNFDELSIEQKSGRDPFTVMMGRIPGFSLQRPSASDRGVTARPGVSDSLNALLSDPIYRMPRLRQGPFVGAPLLFIDNNEVTFDAVYELRATDIDYVEVYKSSSTAAFGSRGFSGAIAIYTLKGKKLFEQTPKPGMLNTRLMGYHAPREFYAPVYDQENRQQYIPDQRATVFWAPMIVTNEKGEASIQFYTPDQSGYVTIDVQGISLKGKPGFGNSGFSIRSNL
ncbi:MAG: Plug domain-containing protein [Roseivirga sp.]|nr:Plug domain-containing protein [Roseivirga sp.]